MGRISMKSQYDFKEDYCRKCISNLYKFNEFVSFIDILNNVLDNTEKMSWKSWYYMYCDEEDNIYLSKQLMIW